MLPKFYLRKRYLTCLQTNENSFFFPLASLVSARKMTAIHSKIGMHVVHVVYACFSSSGVRTLLLRQHVSIQFIHEIYASRGIVPRNSRLPLSCTRVHY